MTNKEKVKHIRDITLSPISKISDALKRANDDVDAAIKILINEKSADANDMANRVANASIVYSYVHNNKIGAMITLACQTDFVAKNDIFLGLAKDICMHVVSNPVVASFVSESNVDEADKAIIILDALRGHESKPQNIQHKISEGRLTKFYNEKCLLNQKFIKDDTITIKELINRVSSTLGEKIELKKFVRIVA